MLGVLVKYGELERMFRKELQVEWVRMPLRDEIYMSRAKRDGKVELFGETYTPSDLESLKKETEGHIAEVKFSHGPCEGYMLQILMRSCQVILVKTFERETLEILTHLINYREAARYEEPSRRIYMRLPVGSIVYVVTASSNGPLILPYQIEKQPNDINNYHLCLKGINPIGEEIYQLQDNWERWPNVFFRIEDAIAYSKELG